MRSVLSIAIACFSLILNAHTDPQLDSLALQVNSSNSNMTRMLTLEKALSAIANEHYEQITAFESLLDYNKLNTHNLLLLESFEAKRLSQEGKMEEVLEVASNNNPFIKFYKGNAHFYLGNNRQAVTLSREAAQLFSYYDDTVYIASCYNNIGAIHWHLNNLDSALQYFQKAKSYTYWYNEMLENNILAISNALNNENLSRQQISTILSNSDKKTTSPYFLNNAYYFYKKHDVSKIDSMKTLIKETYPNLSSVPLPIMPIFIENKWNSDSIKFRLLAAAPNSFFDNALRNILTSDLIGDSAYNRATLKIFANKTTTFEDSVIAGIMSDLEEQQRIDLARSLRGLIEDERIEDSERLRYSSRSLTNIIEKQQFTIQKYIVTILSILSFGLILLLFEQRRKMRHSKERLELANKNIELARENVFVQTEIKKARQGIEDIASNSLREIKKLRSAVDKIADNPNHVKEILSDLNVLTIHEEGMLRFKIKRMADELSSPLFEQLQNVLNDKESQVLKLTILEFRSKEISALLGVTPQHVNNLRSRIKNKVEEKLNQNYEELMKTLSKEFFLS